LKLTELESRYQVGQWLTANGMLETSVEIGVHDGGNAMNIASNWSGTLHLVDPWEPQSIEIYLESPYIDFPSVERLARQRMAEYGKRIIFHKCTSDELFERWTFGLCDFVYIDGNHSKEQVSRDIQQWWTLLKPGGLFGGHDFMLPTDSRIARHCMEIAPIVMEFADSNRVNLHITKEPWPASWWIQKPEKTS
jgi:hypothetical protein